MRIYVAIDADGHAVTDCHDCGRQLYAWEVVWDQDTPICPDCYALVLDVREADAAALAATQ